jgi:hypothetical protein
MRYSVKVNDQIIATELKLREAIKTAKAEAQEEDNLVFITWFRSSDGQHGYYNSDGNHAITGKSW